MPFEPAQDTDASGGNMKVVRHDPVRERRQQLLLILFFVCFGAMAFWFGASRDSGNISGLASDKRTLQAEVVRLEAHNEKLSDRIAVLERSSQIDRQAVELVRAQFRDLEQERDEMARNMVFYQSIVAPEDQSEGVKLSAFDLMPGESSNQYRLRVIVSQFSRMNNFLRGNLKASVKGLQDGKDVSLSLLELAGAGASPTLGFRYFQAFPDDRGFMDFELPDNFTPKTITISANIRSGGARSLNKTYDWQEELAADVGQEQAGE